MIPYLLAVAGGYLIGSAQKDGGIMAKGGITKKAEWVVYFVGKNQGRKSYHVNAKSESEAVDKGFRELSNDGENSDDYSVATVNKL